MSRNLKLLIKCGSRWCPSSGVTVGWEALRGPMELARCIAPAGWQVREAQTTSRAILADSADAFAVLCPECAARMDRQDAPDINI